MDFFMGMTTARTAGLILLLVGALVTFLSGKLTARAHGKYANLTVKCMGLGLVVAGFILVMFV